MFNDMSGDNHEFTISGVGVDREPLNVFSIDPLSGVVNVNKPVDREKYEEPFHVSKYWITNPYILWRFLTIRNNVIWPPPQIKFDIFDKFTKQRLDKELSFDVEIKDINDNPPTFAKPRMTVNVMENTPEGKHTDASLTYRACIYFASYWVSHIK